MGRRRQAYLVVLAVLALLLEPAPRQAPAWTQRLRRLVLDPAAFVSGDLVFRRGRSLVSDAVLAAEGGGEFTHVGLAAASEGRVWVLHALPPEDGVKGGVIAEPLEAFLAPEKASTGALYRPRDGRAAAVAVEAAWKLVRGRVPFDDAFDLTTVDKLYCTELVWRAYLTAGVDLESGISTPRGKYLLPDRLEQSPQLKFIQTFRQETANR